jgi:hypothetical protein
MKSTSPRSSALALITTSLLAACGGGPSNGGPGATAAPPATPTTPAAPGAVTAGIWQGELTSATTQQPTQVLALTLQDGSSVWMMSDGRVMTGLLPSSGERFSASFMGHMLEGSRFPDGTLHGTAQLVFEHHGGSTSDGRYMAGGDSGTFRLSMMTSVWNRPASLEALAGVYSRTTAAGYTMTMSINADGVMNASDSRGCVFSGLVTVPNPARNVYRLGATVSSCGTLDGAYAGLGTLVDADAMRDWMNSMHPFEFGGHSHGASMGGGGMMGGNTIPSGQQNLFMFALTNGQQAIMDALAR